MPRLALLSACLGAAALCVVPIYSLDVWWHLSMGQAVWRHGARVVPEPVAFTGPEAYVDPEWLFDVGLLALFDAAGVPGLIAALAVFAAIHVVLLAWVARAAGADGGAAVVLAAVTAGATSAAFLPRPQVLFLTWMPLAMALALTVRRHAGRTRWLGIAGLHVVLALWSQTHTSIAIAPVVACALAFGPWPDAPRLSVTEGLSLAALALWPFAGPFGVGVVDQVLRHSDTDATRYITDMRPTTLADLLPTGSDGAILLDLLVVAAVVVTVRRRRVALGPLLLVGLGLALALTAVRFRSAWAVLLLPVIASGLVGLRTPPWAVWLGGLLLPSVAVMMAPRLGVGLDAGMVATELADELDRRGVRGRILNEYAMGGVLGWRLAPELRVFIDGRTPVHFDADDLFAYRKLVRDPVVLDRLIAMHEPQAVAIDRSRPTCPALAARPGWGAVWTDATRVLFLPGGAAEVDAPCLDPVDPTPPRADGLDRLDAWDALLAAGRADAVLAEARPLVHRAGHEVDPRVRARLALACDAVGDTACVGSHGWRAALQGQDQLVDPLVRVAPLLDPSAQRRVRALVRVMAAPSVP